jgi:zinc D-Ala-D-Ala dipeptidase
LTISQNDRDSNLVQVLAEPGLKIDLKYAGVDNFLKKNIYGDLTECWLHKEAYAKIYQAADNLRTLKTDWSLVIYDAFRPQKYHLKLWQAVVNTEFESYVANPERGSIHSFGFAVDVSLLDSYQNPVDMGCQFDHFGELASSHRDAEFQARGKLTALQVANKRLLKETMTSAGFTGINLEWWHFNALPPEEVRKKYQMIE